jgi:hypothetical protein
VDDQLGKRPDQDSSNDGAVTTKVEEKINFETQPLFKMGKNEMVRAIPDIPVADRTSMFGLKLAGT